MENLEGQLKTAEGIGSHLQQWRAAQRLTTTQLAARAGIRRATLSEWQAGKRRPRLPELEAVLDALGASDAQRRKARELLHTPGSLLRLRQETEAQNRELTEIAGAAPHGGDLIRALRLRKGWTQTALAHALQVSQATLTRWERAECWPDMQTLHTLCYLLEAQEAEITALTLGRFALNEGQSLLTEEEIRAQLNHITMTNRISSEYALAELRLLTLSAQAWRLAGQEKANRGALALVASFYADHLFMQHRFGECREVAARALDIYRDIRLKDSITEHTVMRLAEATAQRGDRYSLQSAVQLLQTWLPYTSDKANSTWMQSELGLYKTACGQVEEGIALGEQAVERTASLGEPIEDWYRRLDLARILLRANQPRKAQEVLLWIAPHPYYSMVRAQVHLHVGEQEMAYRLIQEVLTTLESRTPNLSEPEALYYRPEAETLAEQL